MASSVSRSQLVIGQQHRECYQSTALKPLIAAQRGWVSPPVAVCCASGDKQTVDFNLNAEGARDVTLTGPAVFIFEGTVEYDG